MAVPINMLIALRAQMKRAQFAVLHGIMIALKAALVASASPRRPLPRAWRGLVPVTIDSRRELQEVASRYRR